MAPQPAGEHLGGAVVQQIDSSVGLQVDEHCAVATPLPTQGQVIDAQHSRAARLLGIGQGMEEPQERIWADGHAGCTRQASTTLAASLQREGGQQLCGVAGASGVAGQHATEPFGEDLPRAGWRIAEPAPAVDTHADRVAAPREIQRAPLIPTVLSAAWLTTLRTRNACSRWLNNKDETPIPFDDDQDDAPAFCDCLKRRGHRCVHPRWPR